jgi:hypothetical protein
MLIIKKGYFMDRIQFRPLGVNRLHYDELVGLCDTTQEIFRKHAAEMDVVISKMIQQLEEQTTLFRHTIFRQGASKRTAQMIVLDELRDEYSSELLRDVKYHLQSKNAAKRDAANSLNLFLKPYGIFFRVAQDTQTATTRTLLKQIAASGVLSLAVETLHLKENLEALEKVNEQFDELFVAHNKEYGLDITQHMVHTLKPDLLYTYKRLCHYLEIMHEFNPNPALKSVFEDMEALRRTYRNLLEKRRLKPIAEQQMEVQRMLEENRGEEPA